jgi:hypothetical protein
MRTSAPLTHSSSANRQCVKYCGPTLPVQSGTTGCSMPCAGDASEACGGPDRLTVYTSFSTNPGPAGWTSLGCYTDSVQARTLTVLEQVAGGTDAMTPEACTSTCAGAGYKYAGVECTYHLSQSRSRLNPLLTGVCRRRRVLLRE